jgi:hypothetical protein
MGHLHDEFDADPEDIIEVTLDRAANVQLLDPDNYENYRNGHGYRYRGGTPRRARSLWPYRVPAIGTS